MSRRLAPVLALVATLAVLLGTSGSASSKPPCQSNSQRSSCPPLNTSPPSISGTPMQGQTLSAGGDSWQGTPPIGFAYQWRRCDSSGTNCSSMSGATSQSYTLGSSDVGATIRVTVTASNSAGSSSADSAPTAPVASPPTAVPPSDTTPPSISGTALVGQTLSASPGSWSGTTPMTYSYQWRRCDSSGVNCIAISGATGQAYTLGSGDVGATELVSVTASNSAGSGFADSAPTQPIESATPPSNTTLPSISGSVQSGQTLTASPGGWSATTPISYAYQWLRCDSSGVGCVSVSGATGQTYMLGSADVGFTLRVKVMATSAAGSASAQSAQTAIVQAAALWTNVLNDQFNDGVIPAHYVLYDGPYPNGGNCATPSHVSVSGGYLHLLMRYETSGKCGAAWYTAGLSIAPAYRGAPYNMAAVQQRVTIRFRIVNGGVSSHRIIPMRSPVAVPYSPNGEEDFCENDGPLDFCNTFLHYGSSGRIWHRNTVDLTQWHTMRFEDRNYTIRVYIDNMTTPVWTYVGNSTTVPNVTRKLVLQQECPSVYAHCPAGTTGTEDIQVDWITVDNAT